MSYGGYTSSPRILHERGLEQRDARQGAHEQRPLRRTPTVLLLAVCAVLVVLALPACSVSARPASIGDAKMATDKDGKHPTEAFSPNDTFYFLADLNDAPEDTTVRAVWTAASVKGVKPDTEIKQMSAEGGSGRLQFALSSKSPWPKGEYEVKLYLNEANKPTKTLAFEVG